MKKPLLQLDRDWQREGFNLGELQTDELEIGFSERLTSDPVLMAVLTYIGGQALNLATDGAISRTIDKLLNFARSRNKRLKLHTEQSGVDPRVQTLMANIESASKEEFHQALQALPLLQTHVNHVLSSTPEYITDLWYVWERGDWKFSYYLTEGGEMVDKLPTATGAQSTQQSNNAHAAQQSLRDANRSKV